MTRSLDYQRRNQVIKSAPAKGQIATGKMPKPRKSKNDEQESPLGSHEKQPIPYDMKTKGSLPYFQFYLDEVVQSANAAEPTEKRQSISTSAFLGVWGVAATVVSGLLIGDALNQPTTPLDTKIPPLKPKQRVAFSVLRPTSAAPEKLTDQRFVPRSQRESQPPGDPPAVAVSRLAPHQNPVEQPTAQNFAPLLPSVTLAAVPEILPVSHSSAPKRTVTGAPAPAGMKPLVRPAYQDLPDLQRPPQTPLTALNSPPASAIAPPETIKLQQPAVTSIPVNPTQPSATPTNPASPAQANAESPPTTPPAVGELTAPTQNPTEPATAPLAVPTNNPTTNLAPVNPTSNAIDIEGAQWRSQKSGVD